MNRTRILAFAAVAVFVAGCTAASARETPAPDEPTSGPPAGMCLEGVPDCVDTELPTPNDDRSDASPDEYASLTEARALLGLPEHELLTDFPDVRIARRGDEHFALTEDYVIGRRTASLDDDGTGVFRVVQVVVEAVDGPVVLDAES